MQIKKSAIRDCEIHESVVIVEPVNLYECSIKSKCFVGPFVEIQKNVLIKENSKIQSHSFICEGTSIGKNTFIGHGVMFINDKFKNGGPAMGDKNLWGKIVIGDNVSIGSNCTILPCKIIDNVIIGAGSVVTKDINEPGIYVGNPAKKLVK